MGIQMSVALSRSIRKMRDYISTLLIFGAFRQKLKPNFDFFRHHVFGAPYKKRLLNARKERGYAKRIGTATTAYTTRLCPSLFVGVHCSKELFLM